MKKSLIICYVCLAMSLFSVEANKDTLSLGFKLEEINDNLGINLDIVSPTVLNFFNVRAGVGYVLEKPDYGSTHIKAILGLRGYGGGVNSFIKLYGEAGALFLQKESLEFGVYGLFGFEFFTRENYISPVSYYIELGTNSAADDLYEGFSTAVGFRYYF